MYRMPAEWESQSAIWLSWPHNEETWPDNLSVARVEFRLLVQAIATVQTVNILVGAKQRDSAKPLSMMENVNLIEIPTNDAWARDYAPTFVTKTDNTQPELVAIDWHYNAWGGKYPPFDDDQAVTKRVAEYLNIECIAPRLCFEGGAIEINESGVLLSTKTCVLDPNRNPDVTLEHVEGLLEKYLGAKVFIWLSGDAIEGDDTDGHIDQLARFTDNETIVYAWTDDESDSQRPALEQNLNDLKSGLEKNGLDYRLVPLPIPDPFELYGRRIPASYCNFLITNGLVLVPKFDKPEDEVAIDTLKTLFPNHRVIGLPSKNLSVGLGSFHCLSQQQPA
ncbi:MAG: agmatine/peptidylarginine deiminase [Mariniblastus sp.]